MPVHHLRSLRSLLFGVLATASTYGCVDTTWNLNYCANAGGDALCLEHGQEDRIYCLNATEACVDLAPPPLRSDPNFNGCVAQRPSNSCYSPCGGRRSIDEDDSCIGATDASSQGGQQETSSGTGTDAETTAASVGSTGHETTSETTDGCPGVPSSFPWGGCMNELGVVDTGSFCGANASCTLVGSGTPDDSVRATACSAGCVDPCQCPDAPQTGNATVACGEIDAQHDGNECYLDCSDDSRCPDGMSCTATGFCATPTIPSPLYGSCAPGCTRPGECASGPDGISVCVTACVAPGGSCAATPDPESAATPTCGWAINPPLGGECYLNCSSGPLSCPQGMVCAAPSTMTLFAPGIHQPICMWPAVLP